MAAVSHWPVRTARVAARPRSLVRTTTSLLIGIAAAVGATFGATATYLAHHYEHARIDRDVGALLDGTTHVAAIAAYLEDDALAGEIVADLLVNDIVAGVRIEGASRELAASHRAGVAGRGAELSRAIVSPFDAARRIGTLTVVVSEAAAHARTRTFATTIAILLGLQVAVVAAGTAWVVYLRVTRPIKRLSDDLHRIELPAGGRLQVPAGHARDELGTLVADVNALLGSVISLLSAERRARLEREMGERQLQLIFDHATSGLFVVDAQGRLESSNAAFERQLGGPPPGRAADALGLVSRHAPEAAAMLRRVLDTGEAGTVEMAVAHADETRWLELAANPLGTGLLGVVNDVTERKRAELTAKNQATCDALTGLLNRRGLDDALQVLRIRDARDRRCALLQIDLDRFKEVNDRHGHEAGDRVLVHAAAAIRRCIRRADLAARPGGDEFAVVLVGVDDPSQAMRVADSIRDAIAQPIALGGATVAVGASIGVAVADGRSFDAADLARRADSAMYAVKRAASKGRRGSVPA